MLEKTAAAYRINLLILVMRNQGSLRLILNTQLWEQMIIKRANRKSLCFTATDQVDHSVQVFLTQVSGKQQFHPRPHFIQNSEGLLKVSFSKRPSCSVSLDVQHRCYMAFIMERVRIIFQKNRCDDKIWP